MQRPSDKPLAQGAGCDVCFAKILSGFEFSDMAVRRTVGIWYKSGPCSAC